MKNQLMIVSMLALFGATAFASDSTCRNEIASAVSTADGRSAQDNSCLVQNIILDAPSRTLAHTGTAEVACNSGITSFQFLVSPAPYCRVNVLLPSNGYTGGCTGHGGRCG